MKRAQPYILITGKYEIDGDIHTGYGIGYSDTYNPLSFEDLTTDPIAVTNLIKLCNDLDLSPIHLEDVVEDFLFEAT